MGRGKRFSWKGAGYGLIVGLFCMMLVYCVGNIAYGSETTYNKIRSYTDSNGNKDHCYDSVLIRNFDSAHMIVTENGKEYNWKLLLCSNSSEQRIGKLENERGYIDINGITYRTEFKVSSVLTYHGLYSERIKIILNRHMVEEIAYAEEVKLGLFHKGHSALSPYKIYTSLNDPFRAGIKSLLLKTE